MTGTGDPSGPAAGDAPAADVELLARALHHPDGAVRDRAARALGDRRDPNAIPALVAAVRDGRGGRGAVWALTQFHDPRLVAPLAGALADGDATARALAAGKLADLCDRAAVPALVAALEDSEAHVREEVTRALGRLGDPAALEPLLHALRADPGDHVREAAATAVGTLGGADPRAVHALRAACDDRHVMVRRAAAEALDAPRATFPAAPAPAREVPKT